MASIKLKGDTSGEVTISAPAVAGTTTLELPATSSTLATQNALGVRNLIINGDMRIAQRGTSQTGITGNGYFTCDRWRDVIISAGTWTQTQDTDVPTGQGFSSSIKMQCTTADASLSGTDQVNINQRIEGQNLQHLKYGTSNAEQLTLSFWVKSNKTGTYVAWFYQEDGNRQTNKTYTIDSADTWEKKTLTFAGDTVIGFDNDNGNGLEVRFVLGSGSDYTSGTSPNGTWEAFTNPNAFAGQTVNLADSTSNYINITGVQLEVGDTATPFEHRPYDMELARCYRYYYRINSSSAFNAFSQRNTGVYNTTTQLIVGYNLPVSMRGTITVSYSDLAHFDIEPFDVQPTALTMSGSNSEFNGYTVRVDDTTARTQGFAGKLVCDTSPGFIDFDAEL